MQKVWQRQALINVHQQGAVKVTLDGPFTRLHVKFSLVVSCHCEGNTLPGQLKKLITILKNHTALHDRTAIEERTKNSGETIKRIFWQTSINEQRPKFKKYE